MTDIACSTASETIPAAASATIPVIERKGAVARFFDALVEARMRQAQREIVKHLRLLPPAERARVKHDRGLDDAPWS